MEVSNLCNASSARNNLIKLTHYGDTKTMAHDTDSQLKKLSGCATVDPAKDKHQAPTQMKALRQGRH